MTNNEHPPAALRRRAQEIEPSEWYSAGNVLVLVYPWPAAQLPDIRTMTAQLAAQGWQLIRYQVEPHAGSQRLIAMREIAMRDKQEEVDNV